MKLTRNIPQGQRGSEHRLPRLLLLALVAMATAQTATTAFSQEEVDPSPPAPQRTVPVNDMKSRVLQIPQGAFVEAQLVSARVLEGQLGDVVDQGFVLRTVRNGSLGSLLVLYEDLRSIRPIPNPYPRNPAFDRHFQRNRRIMRVATRGHRGFMGGSLNASIVSVALEALAAAR
jgi:hypothetical protein